MFDLWLIIFSSAWAVILLHIMSIGIDRHADGQDDDDLSNFRRFFVGFCKVGCFYCIFGQLSMSRCSWGIKLLKISNFWLRKKLFTSTHKLVSDSWTPLSKLNSPVETIHPASSTIETVHLHLTKQLLFLRKTYIAPWSSLQSSIHVCGKREKRY